MTSPPAMQPGIGNTDACCYCKKNDWRKKSVRRDTRDMSGGWYHLPVEWEITTWQCANPKCEKQAIRQSERMVGAYE